MNYKPFVLLLLSLSAAFFARGQKTFTEGIIVYKVTMEAKEQKFSGTYTFTFKGSRVKKELKLDKGYQDIVLLDFSKNKAYSLEVRNGKKYAIELSMDDIRKMQEPFGDYTIKNEENDNKKIAGFAAYKGNINYQNGVSEDVLYTKEWQPSQAVTFDHFPNARFLPLYFTHKNDNGTTMIFEAEKIEAMPIENIVFRIPQDYKIISNAEYKKLSQ